MKKKILVAGLACVLSLGCAFGATACSDNGGGGAKGTEVTAEQWTAAFEELYNSDNITYSIIMTEYYFMDDMKLVPVKTYANVYCTSSIIFMDAKSEYYGKKCNYVINVEDITYSVEAEINDDGETIEDWAIRGYNSQSVEDYRLMVLNYETFFNLNYNSDNGKAALIKDLYSVFEFKDGTYSAILNYKGMEFETNIRFDGDKIIYCKADAGEVMGMSYVYEFSDYGTTTVTLSEDAQKALDDYIAARA